MEVKKKLKIEKIFFENFNGLGAGFNGSPFEAWSVGGVPVGAGHWERFYEGSDAPNLTYGKGDYAAIRLHSPELLDTLVWMTSPVIDVRQYSDLVLSTDIYFRAGGEVGEEVATIQLLRAGYPPQVLNVIGETMSAHDEPLKQHMRWNISPDSEFIQVAFTWVSGAGGPGHDSMQVDNIKVTGKPRS